MPIEITGLPTTQPTSINEGQTTRTRTDHKNPDQSKNESETPSQVDTVLFTETATQLQAMESEIVNVPVVDMERVEEIQRLISNGKYEIDTNHLAEKLLRFETQL